MPFMFHDKQQHQNSLRLQTYEDRVGRFMLLSHLYPIHIRLLLQIDQCFQSVSLL
jgi:hypothetical protein